MHPSSLIRWLFPLSATYLPFTLFAFGEVVVLGHREPLFGDMAGNLLVRLAMAALLGSVVLLCILLVDGLHTLGARRVLKGKVSAWSCALTSCAVLPIWALLLDRAPRGVPYWSALFLPPLLSSALVRSLALRFVRSSADSSS